MQLQWETTEKDTTTEKKNPCYTFMKEVFKNSIKDSWGRYDCSRLQILRSWVLYCTQQNERLVNQSKSKNFTFIQFWYCSPIDQKIADDLCTFVEPEIKSSTNLASSDICKASIKSRNCDENPILFPPEPSLLNSPNVFTKWDSK